MLKIKLSPVGRKNQPAYRIVVAQDRSKITGRYLANLGYYNPVSKQLSIDKKLVDFWVAKGAQTTPRIKKLYNLSK
jgi:small subunit ribosomal protein S16